MNPKRTRVLFLSDLHGSTLVFMKALKAFDTFDADILILGGDLSGKRLLPVIPGPNGMFRIAEPFTQKDDTGKTVEIPIERTVPKAEIDTYLKRLEGKGYYWHHTDSNELARLNDQTEELRALFEQKIADRIRKWAELCNQELPEGKVCLWTGGNDDSENMLNQLASENLEKFAYAEHQVKRVADFEIISFGWSNKTPFKTDRELDEDVILERLTSLADRADTTEKLILNVHVPPKNCGTLDACIDPQDPNRYIHVGSEAVRTFIDNIQPLADFAGHVHEGKGEARIGRTHVFNPGSNYNAGVLEAFVVDFSGSQVVDFVHLSR